MVPGRWKARRAIRRTLTIQAIFSRFIMGAVLQRGTSDAGIVASEGGRMKAVLGRGQSTTGKRPMSIGPSSGSGYSRSRSRPPAARLHDLFHLRLQPGDDV